MPRPRRQATDLDHLADRLHAAAIHLLRHVRRTDVESGLSGPALSALSVIVYGGPLRLGALARAEQVRPPTVTRQVQALERDGLVRRRVDPADGRVALVEATAKGRRLLEAGRGRRTAQLVRILATLPPGARRSLARGLGGLEAALRRSRQP